MAMKQCPVCGEKYSDTYKRCPFCEEEEALQNGAKIRRGSGRGGRRAARNSQPNLLSPILVVLILILAGLLVYLLFGDRIADRLFPADDTRDPPVEDVQPAGTEDPDVTEPDDGTMPEEGDQPGTVDVPDDGTGGPADPDEGATPTTPSGTAGTLTVTYMGDPRDDFTMSVGDDPIPLGASGGSGAYTWSSSDDGVASVNAAGQVTAVSAGQATLTVTDGTRTGTCLVRVRGGSASGGSSSGGLSAGSATVVNAASGVRVRSEPNTSSQVLATLVNGDTVRVVQSAGNGWYQITYITAGGQSATGYMMGDYLSNS